MPIFTLLLILIIVGLVIPEFGSMDPGIARIIRLICIVLLVIWLAGLLTGAGPVLRIR